MGWSASLPVFALLSEVPATPRTCVFTCFAPHGLSTLLCLTLLLALLLLLAVRRGRPARLSPTAAASVGHQHAHSRGAAGCTGLPLLQVCADTSTRDARGICSPTLVQAKCRGFVEHAGLYLDACCVTSV
jgi:hypothetical protein